MRDTMQRWIQQLAPDRGELLALAVALLGCVVATLVAVRVPLVAAWGPGESVPANGGAVEGVDGAVAGTPSAGRVLVHVVGAVATPGVVELASGARVADAVAAAGGLRPDAVTGALNLARPVVDGEQVVVPSTDDVAAGVPGPDAAAGVDPVRLSDGRLDLNRATADDLEELPGVGPVLAARIVGHREQHGPFTEAAGLLEVAGIGEATWAELRDLVGVR